MAIAIIKIKSRHTVNFSSKLNPTVSGSVLFSDGLPGLLVEMFSGGLVGLMVEIKYTQHMLYISGMMSIRLLVGVKKSNGAYPG